NRTTVHTGSNQQEEPAGVAPPDRQCSSPDTSRIALDEVRLDFEDGFDFRLSDTSLPSWARPKQQADSTNTTAEVTAKVQPRGRWAQVEFLCTILTACRGLPREESLCFLS